MNYLINTKKLDYYVENDNLILTKSVTNCSY